MRDDETLGLAVAALGNVRRRSATFGRDLVGVARDDGTLGRPEPTFGRRSATFGRDFFLARTLGDVRRNFIYVRRQNYFLYNTVQCY